MPDVVTAILVRNRKILLLRRSDAMGSMPGLWAGVSGSIEGDEQPLARAVTEISEELGVLPDEVTLIRAGPPVTVASQGLRWRVHPFLFEAHSSRVILNRENSEFRWVRREDVSGYDAVPGLEAVLSCLL